MYENKFYEFIHEFTYELVHEFICEYLKCEFINEFIYEYTKYGDKGAPNLAIRLFQIRTIKQTSALAPRQCRDTESVRRLLVTESVIDSVTPVTLAAACAAGLGG